MPAPALAGALAGPTQPHAPAVAPARAPSTFFRSTSAPDQRRPGQRGLLDAAEEQALAARILTGRVAQATLAALADERTERADERADERVLREQVADGQCARETFICSNLRLVTAIARRYARRGLPLEDLVQEGCLGLARAVDRFDASKGFRFSTYATWWVRQAIQDSLGNVRIVRRPHHIEESLRKVRAIEAALFLTLARNPTTAEIAEQAAMTVTEVAALLRVDAPEASPDASAAGIDGSAADPAWSLAMALPDAGASAQMAAVEVDYDNSRARAALAECLSALPDLQRRVLVLRYGWGREDPLDLRQVADRLGEDVLAVRRAEVSALRHLRGEHPVLRQWR